MRKHEMNCQSSEETISCGNFSIRFARCSLFGPISERVLSLDPMSPSMFQLNLFLFDLFGRENKIFPEQCVIAGRKYSITSKFSAIEHPSKICIPLSGDVNNTLCRFSSLENLRMNIIFDDKKSEEQFIGTSILDLSQTSLLKDKFQRDILQRIVLPIVSRDRCIIGKILLEICFSTESRKTMQQSLEIRTNICNTSLEKTSNDELSTSSFERIENILLKHYSEGASPKQMNCQEEKVAKKSRDRCDCIRPSQNIEISTVKATRVFTDLRKLEKSIDSILPAEVSSDLTASGYESFCSSLDPAPPSHDSFSMTSPSYSLQNKHDLSGVNNQKELGLKFDTGSPTKRIIFPSIVREDELRCERLVKVKLLEISVSKISLWQRAGPSIKLFYNLDQFIEVDISNGRRRSHVEVKLARNMRSRTCDKVDQNNSSAPKKKVPAYSNYCDDYISDHKSLSRLSFRNDTDVLKWLEGSLVFEIVGDNERKKKQNDGNTFSRPLNRSIKLIKDETPPDNSSILKGKALLPLKDVILSNNLDLSVSLPILADMGGKVEQKGDKRSNVKVGSISVCVSLLSETDAMRKADRHISNETILKYCVPELAPSKTKNVLLQTQFDAIARNSNKSCHDGNYHKNSNRTQQLAKRNIACNETIKGVNCELIDKRSMTCFQLEIKLSSLHINDEELAIQPCHFKIVLDGGIGDIFHLDERDELLLRECNKVGFSWKPMIYFDNSLGKPLSNLIDTKNLSIIFELWKKKTFDEKCSLLGDVKVPLSLLTDKMRVPDSGTRTIPCIVPKQSYDIKNGNKKIAQIWINLAIGKPNQISCLDRFRSSCSILQKWWRRISKSQTKVSKMRASNDQKLILNRDFSFSQKNESKNNNRLLLKHTLELRPMNTCLRARSDYIKPISGCYVMFSFPLLEYKTSLWWDATSSVLNGTVRYDIPRPDNGFFATSLFPVPCSESSEIKFYFCSSLTNSETTLLGHASYEMESLSDRIENSKNSYQYIDIPVNSYDRTNWLTSSLKLRIRLLVEPRPLARVRAYRSRAQNDSHESAFPTFPFSNKGEIISIDNKVIPLRYTEYEDNKGAVEINVSIPVDQMTLMKDIVTQLLHTQPENAPSEYGLILVYFPLGRNHYRRFKISDLFDGSLIGEEPIQFVVVADIQEIGNVNPQLDLIFLPCKTLYENYKRDLEYKRDISSLGWKLAQIVIPMKYFLNSSNDDECGIKVHWKFFNNILSKVNLEALVTIKRIDFNKSDALYGDQNQSRRIANQKEEVIDIGIGDKALQNLINSYGFKSLPDNSIDIIQSAVENNNYERTHQDAAFDSSLTSFNSNEFSSPIINEVSVAIKSNVDQTCSPIHSTSDKSGTNSSSSVDSLCSHTLLQTPVKIPLTFSSRRCRVVQGNTPQTISNRRFSFSPSQQQVDKQNYQDFFRCFTFPGAGLKHLPRKRLVRQAERRHFSMTSNNRGILCFFDTNNQENFADEHKSRNFKNQAWTPNDSIDEMDIQHCKKVRPEISIHHESPLSKVHFESKEDDSLSEQSYLARIAPNGLNEGTETQSIASLCLSEFSRDKMITSDMEQTNTSIAGEDSNLSTNNTDDQNLSSCSSSTSSISTIRFVDPKQIYSNSKMRETDRIANIMSFQVQNKNENILYDSKIDD